MYTLTEKLLSQKFQANYSKLKKMFSHYRRQDPLEYLNSYYINVSKYIGDTFNSEKDFDNLFFGTIYMFCKHVTINMQPEKLTFRRTNRTLNETEFANMQDDEVFGIDELAAKFQVTFDTPETLLMIKDSNRVLNEALLVASMDAPKSTDLMIKWAHEEVVTSYNHGIKSHYTNGKKRLRSLIDPSEINLTVYEQPVFTIYGKPYNQKRITHEKCTQPGCTLKHKARGLCNKHYQLLIRSERHEQQALPSLHNN